MRILSVADVVFETTATRCIVMWALALVAFDPKEGSMMDTTGLAIAGRRISVPRLFKRLLQIAVVLGLTGAVLFVIIVSNGMLAGRQPSLQAGVNMWLAFVKRLSDISTREIDLAA